ncbi:Rab36 [Columba livia]|nr:Rab36 [Columba livia]
MGTQQLSCSCGWDPAASAAARGTHLKPVCSSKSTSMHRSGLLVNGALEHLVHYVSRLKISKVVVVGDLYVGKTSLINRFCKDNFDRDYKATIGVDFEIERFEIIGVPYNLQIWDTAGQEKFKCIASAYYRGAEGENNINLILAVTGVIITVFDLADIRTLDHTKQWLEDALRENEPDSSFIFLVGTKKDLVSDAVCERTELDAIRFANEMQAEYWSVSAKTGENVKQFFSRVAALAFEQSMIKELENSAGHMAQIGTGNLIKLEKNTVEIPEGHTQISLGCC